MIRTAVLALLLSTPALAQTSEPAPAAPAAAAPAPVPATVRVQITTAAGPIVVAVEVERAKGTAANFLRYVDQKRLDGGTFYRAMKITPDGTYGLIQGGVQDGKKLLPPIAHEPTTKTGLSHVDGAISMARAAPGSAQAQFFITIGALTSLDADPKAAGDNLGFAVFGRVVEGMETVKKILDAPVSPTAGDGAMKGQMIAAPIRILGAKRLPNLPPPAVLPPAPPTP
jgi:peptidyl-prolyl cis-trans isomerase A (cyclophilin A)